jgi:hypothetical protein
MTIILGMRTLSSKLTFIQKYIFPLVWLTFIGYLVYVGFSDAKNPAKSVSFRWGALFFLLMSLLIFCFWNFPLKFVAVDERSLYISNYFKMIQTPLSNIFEVESLGLGSRLMRIRLKSPTEFGTEILVIPKVNYRITFFGFGVNPIVNELKELAGITDNIER